MISTDELLAACDRALDQYAEVLRDLGDGLVASRPDGIPGNSGFGLVAHLLGVVDRWGSTVNLGVVVPRDRDAEFLATGSLDEALALLATVRERLHAHARAASPRQAPANPPADDPDGYATQSEVLLHVYEELAQHLGQLEVTRDVLLARRAPGGPATV